MENEASTPPAAAPAARPRAARWWLGGGALAVVLTAFAFVIINFLVDLTYTVLDPRIRYA